MQALSLSTSGVSRGRHGSTHSWINATVWSLHMPTRDDIERAILGVTGAPDTGLLHDATPAIVDAIDELLNPKPTEAAAYKPAKETR